METRSRTTAPLVDRERKQADSVGDRLLEPVGELVGAGFPDEPREFRSREK